jgi:hypothetical protein
MKFLYGPLGNDRNGTGFPRIPLQLFKKMAMTRGDRGIAAIKEQSPALLYRHP